MRAFAPSYSRSIPRKSKEPLVDLSIPAKDFDSFGRRAFGLHHFRSDGEPRTILAAMFDLEGFTAFTDRRDPHLFVPQFVDWFLGWLFETVKSLTLERRAGDSVFLWSTLPFFAKYTGDGALLLWDLDHPGLQQFCRRHHRDRDAEIHGDVGNIVSILYDTCRMYARDQLPELKKHHPNPPRRLRCGVAQGQVSALAGGRDFVGACINLASRVQKLGKLGFSILATGFDLSRVPAERLRDVLVKKRTQVRLSDQQTWELVYVIKSDFEALDPKDKADFVDP